MQTECPKCKGAMRIFRKSLSDSIVPFPYISIKSRLPAELQRYDFLEVRVCENCGYTETYFK